MKYFCAFVLGGTFLVGLAGCGTIIHGNDQQIGITSTPSGAEVLYDGAVRGITPCQVSISRRPLKTVLVLQKDGYENEEVTIKAEVSLWALLGNIVIGGIPGYIIDAATGSFGAYYTETYAADLSPMGVAEGREATEVVTSDVVQTSTEATEASAGDEE